MSVAFRTPTERDLPEVVRLMSEHSPEPVDEDYVRRAWTSPRVSLENDARLEANGYAIVEELDAERVWIEFWGHPSDSLMEWAERRARERGQRLFAGGWASNEPLLRDLDRRGFSLVRHAHRMVIDLTELVAEPAWPDGIEVRTFAPGDERVFYDAHQETFRDSWEPIEEPYDEWAHWLLAPPSLVPDLWFLAVAEGEPAGFAICHPHRTSADMGWIRILGVRRSWRRRGLGRALLLHAFAEFRQRGFRLAGLGVDAESLTGANRLYESAGMHITARFSIYEKAAA